MAQQHQTVLPKEQDTRAAERIYHEWDSALGAKDIEAAVALYYPPDCRLESPLVRHLPKSEQGVVVGREKLRDFLKIVFDRTPPVRERYREGFFTDGRKLMWEYPREKPNGEQMEFVEVMELGGRIDPPPPRLLGLVRRQGPRARPLPSPNFLARRAVIP